jgi:hypothetical protein
MDTVEVAVIRLEEPLVGHETGLLEVVKIIFIVDLSKAWLNVVPERHTVEPSHRSGYYVFLFRLFILHDFPLGDKRMLALVDLK